MEKKTWMGLIIVFLMISSVFGFVFSFGGGGSNVQEYSEVKFRYVNNQWMARINGEDRGFLFFPGDLEYIDVPGEAKALLEEPGIAVTYDPASNLSENFAEAQYYFEVQLDSKFIERALTNSEGTSLPEKSCADATPTQPVILLTQEDESAIRVEGSCIIIASYDSFAVYQQTERVIYAVLGVME